MRLQKMLAALVAVLGLAAAAPAEMYNAQYLAPFAEPAAMNQDGTVVGWNPVYRTPFFYDDVHGYAALPCPKAYTACNAVDVNDSGVIVGWAQFPGVMQLRTAAIWMPITDPTEVPAFYRFAAIAAFGRFNSSEAVAIDNSDRVIGLRSAVRIGTRQQPESFVWTAASGMRRLPVPGPVVDIDDSGWVTGNAEMRMPYLFRLDDKQLRWTRLPAGYVSATSHAIGADGTVVGSLINDIGLSIAARTDGDDTWTALGGGGVADHLFGINKSGDVVGHVHGLDPNSHCGVQFSDEGELKTLESLFHPRTQTWTVGESITGPTDARWLASLAVNAKSGLPALIRLVPGKAEECGGNCLWIASLELNPRTGPGVPGGWSAVARLGPTMGAISPVTLDATWIHDGGAIVERMQYQAGADGSVRLTTPTRSKTVQLFVTAVRAAGYRFDPTRGDLHAER